MAPDMVYPDRNHAEFRLQEKWTVLGGLLAAYCFYLIIWAKFLSPTAQVPGDLIDKMTGIRRLVTTLTGQRMYFIDRQLKKHGKFPPLFHFPEKQLGGSLAEDVALADAVDSNAIKTIYSSHEWRKSSFYSDFADFLSVPSLFSETNPPRAQMLRRAFLPAFSRANILSMSPVIFAHIENFLKKLDEFEARGKPLECYRWFRYLTFEVVTDIGFGGEYDMISCGEVDHPFVNDFDDSVSFGALISMLPFLRWIPRWFWPASLRHWEQAEYRTAAHAKGGLDKWRHQKALGQAGHRVDILQRLIDHGEKYPEEKLSETELICEIMEIMVAGSDTTASTAIYGCYELARYPDVQMKLRRALKESIPDPSRPIRLEDFEACTYLDWTIKEMLRMHPTIPSILERVVPPQGAVIAGHTLKKGSIVAMSAFVQHSQESIFANPEMFEPERWSKETEEMKQNLLTFSTGPRSCVGQNLAFAQLKIHVGMILRSFEASLHPETTPESMLAQDFFQGKPKAGKCLLYFKRVKD